MAAFDIPVAPPLAWFSPPESGIPTDKRITIEASGRAYGYIALKNQCHVGMPGCVKPPLGAGADYSMAHQGETLTAEGDIIKTAVIAGGTGHAPVDMATALVPQYYENMGDQLLRVRYGEDENGLWFAGALWPDVNELTVAKLRASSLSGDWRWHAAYRNAAGQMSLMGACLVNIPGFPMDKGDPAAYSYGQSYAIAASGADVNYIEGEGFLIAAALPYKATAKADTNTPWDGPEVVSHSKGRAMLRLIHAWVDPSGDPEAKSSYKLPHHLPNGEVVLRGVQAAMSRLMQANTQIPDADRQGVYNHLAKHYRQFGLEPPPLRASGESMCSEGCNCGGGTKETERTPEQLIEEMRGIVAKHDEIQAAAHAENDPVERLNTKVDQLTDVVQFMHAKNLADELSQ